MVSTVGCRFYSRWPDDEAIYNEFVLIALPYELQIHYSAIAVFKMYFSYRVRILVHDPWIVLNRNLARNTHSQPSQCVIRKWKMLLSQLQTNNNLFEFLLTVIDLFTSFIFHSEFETLWNTWNKFVSHWNLKPKFNRSFGKYIIFPLKWNRTKACCALYSKYIVCCQLFTIQNAICIMYSQTANGKWTISSNTID